MPFDCEIVLDDVEAACDEADRVLRDLTLDAVATAAREGLAEAKARRTFKDRTGNMTRTAYERLIRVTRTEAEAEVGWPMPYASYLDQGTSPHTIRARGGGMLAFRGLGGTVFRREVHHPGTRAYPFVDAAERKVDFVLRRETERALDRVARILGR